MCLLFTLQIPFLFKPPVVASPSTRKKPILVRSDDGDGDAPGPDDYERMDPDEMEEVDNKKDFEIEYDPLSGAVAPSASGGDEYIAMMRRKSFVSTQGWDSEMVVNYGINEEVFNKISLLDCEFFIRKPPDPDNDVYDFREMYVTPPDTDVYSIPKVLAPRPQKYIRCAKSDYGCYNVTEPPIDAPRDPLYKTAREIQKVFLTLFWISKKFMLLIQNPSQSPEQNILFVFFLIYKNLVGKGKNIVEVLKSILYKRTVASLIFRDQ